MSPVKTKLYRVIKPYRSPYPDSIFFRKGEKVTVGKEFCDDPDWHDWLWCESKNGNRAWAPKQFLEIRGTAGTLRRDYNARELSVKSGEFITVFEPHIACHHTSIIGAMKNVRLSWALLTYRQELKNLFSLFVL